MCYRDLAKKKIKRSEDTAFFPTPILVFAGFESSDVSIFHNEKISCKSAANMFRPILIVLSDTSDILCYYYGVREGYTPPFMSCPTAICSFRLCQFMLQLSSKCLSDMEERPENLLCISTHSAPLAATALGWQYPVSHASRCFNDGGSQQAGTGFVFSQATAGFGNTEVKTSPGLCF